ncbi:MAG: hypothetical protein INH37_14780 [Myxococcaceae bacterium]|nr:hypothetical protein [Myxococcaceae bacterium]
MALVSGSLPSLANGVSQQPPWARLPSQLEAQENAVSSLLDGVTKRPPTQHLARLTATPYGSTEPFTHVIDRDPTNRFKVVITNGDLRVFDLTGVERTVSFPDGKSYLTAADPRSSFAALSVADYTFIVNKTTTVGLTSAPAAPNNWGYLYVKATGYNVRYSVYVNGTLQTTYVTSTTSPERTDDIAASIRTSLAAALGGSWTVEVFASTIRVRRNDNADFRLTATDSQGDTYFIGFREQIQAFQDLPYRSFADAWVEVVGSGANGFDSYYVTYDVNAEIWDESAFPEAARGPSPASMPHRLVRNNNGTFTFSRAPWAIRGAGDAESNPDPSFVGRKITDVFFFRNRLGFLTDENVVLSGVGDDGYFQFYRKTVTTLLDSDPIDIAVTNTTVSTLEHAVPFNKQLLVFSKNRQFIIDADGALTPTTVQAKPATAFSASLSAKPVNAGSSVMFATLRGTNSGVREFLIQPDSLVEDADDITKQVPSYIEGTVLNMASAMNENIVFMTASGNRSLLYVYRFFYEGTNKLQSSWSAWRFPSDEKVLNIGVLDNTLLLLIERPTGVFLERVDLDLKAVDAGVPFSVRLDRKVSVTGVYDAGTNETTWTLPYDTTGWMPVVVRGSGYAGLAGTDVKNVTKVSQTVIKATGNITAGPCLIGRAYTKRMVFSRFTVSQGGDQRGRVAITDGRLQLRTLSVNYSDTGFFKVRVEKPGRDARDEVFQPLRVGIVGSNIGQLALPDGRFRVPILSRNDQVTISIESDSHLPCSILSAEWEGEFVMRSQRT